MKVYYWCPFINPVATVTAVLNSIISLNKFSKNKYEYKIINVFKEWSIYEDELKKNQIECIDLETNLDIKKLPKLGFLKSRFTYILTYLFSITRLHNFLKKEKPEFFIIHLISSIPLTLILLFNYDTKFILRISGYPKMTLFRKFLWKLCDKKLHKVFCPTNSTKNFLVKKNVFSPKKIFLVKDPIINFKKINKNKKKIFEEKIDWLKNKNYIISIGRLTKQKNFKFLINEFSKIKQIYSNLNLVILGDGDEKQFLKKIIKEKKLHENIFILGNKKNIYPFLLNSLFFVLTSEWEDPGFVILEAMFSKKLVLSSNCQSGPKEIIKDNFNGFLYEKNNSDDFKRKFIEIYEMSIKDNDKKNKVLLSGLRTSKQYTLYNHYKDISQHLSR